MKKLFLYAILAAFLSFVNYYTNFGLFVSKSVIYALSPIENIGNNVLDLFSNFTKNYIALQNANEENRYYKNKINKLSIENSILKAKLKSSSTATKINLTKCPFIFKDFSNIDFIYIRSNLPAKYILHKTVVSEKLYLVGTVESKIGNLYKVKTVFNKNFVADCFIINKNSYYRGIFEGAVNKPKIQFLSTQSSIAKNDLVVTSGLLGNMPPNLSLGKISGIYEERGFYKIAFVKIDRSFLNDSFVYVVNGL